MSRREYDRYDERQSDHYQRGGRTERDFEETDYRQSSRYDGPSRRNETVVKQRETDTIATQGHRTERGVRQPDFLREDYGRNDTSRQLVVRDDREEEYVGRRDRSRGPRQTERVERDEVVFRERSRGPPYPRSDLGTEDVVFRERIYPRDAEEIDVRIKEKETNRGPPPPRVYRNDEEITYRPRNWRNVEEERIEIREDRSRSRALPPRERVIAKEEIVIDERSRSHAPPPPMDDFVEKDKITIREQSRGPPPRREAEVEKIDINIRETDREGYRARDRDVRNEEIDIDIKESNRDGYRGRDVRKEEIDIDIRERDRSAPPPDLRRSASRGALVRKDREEWVVRKRRSPSPSPPRDFEKEEITIRRTKERTPSPEPIPEPPPAEPVIYRPPIIQEVITHHRHIDHGFERAPSPPPTPPPPAKEEEDIDINIRRTGTRNGKPFEENINIDIDQKERSGGVERSVNNREIVRREETTNDLRRSVSRRRNYEVEEDTVSAEADYYNRRISSRGYPGEAYNGATRGWAVADIPPGTERVAMDGVGGGRQEITWDRYNGERHGRFVTGDRVYDSGYGNGPAGDFRETRVTETRIEAETSRGSNRERKWTEISKDLVIEEAIKERGYEYEESERYFYVMEYLRYEDVLRLVEVTEDIRRERHERIQELKWESEQRERKMLPPAMPPVPLAPRRAVGGDGSYYYERDVVYERDGGRRFRR